MNNSNDNAHPNIDPNQRLKEKIKELIAKNRTEDALKLLSQAQLSSVDRLVISLNQRFIRVKEDLGFNTISKDEGERKIDEINKTLLDLIDRIDGDSDWFSFITRKKQDPTIDFTKVRARLYWLVPLVVGFLIIVVLIFRVSSHSRSTTYNQLSVDLPNSGSDWDNLKPLYTEDFSNINRPNFRRDIWKEGTYNDYNAGFRNRCFFFDIKKNNYARHKYLGNLPYNAFEHIRPYLVSLKINRDSECRSNCLGRGLSLRYDNKTKSAYTLTINDEGIIRFAMHQNIFTPQKAEILYETKVNLTSENMCTLGVVPNKETIHLYFNGKPIEKLVESRLLGRYFGFIAVGKGNHDLDEVQVFSDLLFN